MHQIAGNLFHRELVEWLVAVEGANYIVAIRPDVSIVIEMQTVSIGVAGVIHPIAGPLLAITRPRQETIHQVFIGSRRLVVYKCLYLCESERESIRVIFKQRPL